MRMSIQNIINNRRRNESLNRPPSINSNNSTNSRINQRTTRNYHFNNGYNRPQRRINGLPPITPRENNTNNEEVINNNLEYQLFNTTININSNNLTSELENTFNHNPYYSTFEYETLNIRFFHNIILNPDNIGNEIENVMNSINEREIQNILNDFQNNEIINNSLQENNSVINSQETIEKIYENISEGEYVHYIPILKNHTCPILLTDFENNDIITLFNLCNHAIHESTSKKYIKTFTKCPLCNHKLFE